MTSSRRSAHFIYWFAICFFILLKFYAVKDRHYVDGFRNDSNTAHSLVASDTLSEFYAETGYYGLTSLNYPSESAEGLGLLESPTALNRLTTRKLIDSKIQEIYVSWPPGAIFLLWSVRQFLVSENYSIFFINCLLTLIALNFLKRTLIHLGVERLPATLIFLLSASNQYFLTDFYQFGNFGIAMCYPIIYYSILGSKRPLLFYTGLSSFFDLGSAIIGSLLYLYQCIRERKYAHWLYLPVGLLGYIVLILTIIYHLGAEPFLWKITHHLAGLTNLSVEPSHPPPYYPWYVLTAHRLLATFEQLSVETLCTLVFSLAAFAKSKIRELGSIKLVLPYAFSCLFYYFLLPKSTNHTYEYIKFAPFLIIASAILFHRLISSDALSTSKRILIAVFCALTLLLQHQDRPSRPEGLDLFKEIPIDFHVLMERPKFVHWGRSYTMPHFLPWAENFYRKRSVYNFVNSEDIFVRADLRQIAIQGKFAVLCRSELCADGIASKFGAPPIPNGEYSLFKILDGVE